MTTLSELWRAFNAAYDAYPGDPLHPARVAAREALWKFQHPEWKPVLLLWSTPF
jgi:hypothetical protein